MLDQFIGQILAEKYRIDSVMRESELGKVYHGTHLLMDKPVAVKILWPALAVDENIVKQFSAEARNVSHISHPNILNVTDFGSDTSGAVYIVFEDADGETLKEAIRRDGTFDPERALRLAKQIAAALSAAHIKGLVHGRLTSENILLTADDSVKVLDLGTLKAGETSGDEISPEKIEYLSPEQCADAGEADERSDIYSLGVILYEMLAGEVPFKAETTSELMMKHAQEPPPPLSAFRHDLPPAIEPVILQTLAKNPEMRHQNAAELIDDFNRASRQLDEAETLAAAGAAGAAQNSNNNIWKTAFVVLTGVSLLSIGLLWATGSFGKRTDPPTLQTDSNAQPVQPINPATGMNEQGLATIVPMTQQSMSNSNTMVVPNTLGGSDTNPYWSTGRVPPDAPVYVPPGGQMIDPSNPNSIFMQDGNTYMIIPNPNANVNVNNAQPTPARSPKTNSANTSVQPSPSPNETPKPQTTPAVRPTTQPKTEQPKQTPSVRPSQESGKTQDSE